ncbi:unnamed protein product [Adineta ricciae]|uniref:Uncharacterized protein n=1 Tax=Adineta ricciae TaxID=249248 RepID=A0A815JJU0_ADIRI|nr:unnamed protein product [Adineta ricciae]CAF1377608.1 unnamed protein product [Adineta ricciae]
MSTGRLLVDQCVDALMKKLTEISEENTKEFNIYLLYRRLTMDVICHYAFGLDTGMQNAIRNEFMIKADACFDQRVETLLLTELSYLMPWITPILVLLTRSQLWLGQFLHRIARTLFHNIVDSVPTMWLQSKVDGTIDARTTASKTATRNDLLQLLLDAAATDESDVGENRLHIDEVKINVFLFTIADYETTSTAMAYCPYILATKYEDQQKLQGEVDELKERGINYDSVTKL